MTTPDWKLYSWRGGRDNVLLQFAFDRVRILGKQRGKKKRKGSNQQAEQQAGARQGLPLTAGGRPRNPQYGTGGFLEKTALCAAGYLMKR